MVLRGGEKVGVRSDEVMRRTKGSYGHWGDEDCVIDTMVVMRRSEGKKWDGEERMQKHFGIHVRNTHEGGVRRCGVRRWGVKRHKEGWGIVGVTEIR